MKKKPVLLLLALFLAGLVPGTGAALEEDRKLDPPKVILIGLDAVSLNIVEPLAAAGALPTLDRLMKEGATGDHRSIWPLRTPQVWTTLVTGKYPGQHGIWDHYSDTKYSPPEFRKKKRTRLTTENRRSKALWNILDDAGIQVMSVGWIASWPAEKLEHGVMLAPPVRIDPAKQVSIKGSFWRDVGQQVQPKSLWPRVKETIVEGSDLSDEDLKAFADVPPAGSPILSLPYIKNYVRALRWSVARARSVEALTLGFQAEVRPELLLFYFQCSDSLLHRFWIFQKPEAEIVERLDTHGIPTKHAAELKARFGRVVQACYEDMDARIGRILEATRGEETLVLVVSDHGFGEAPFPHPRKTEPYGGNHRDDGLLIAAAPWIEKGSRLPQTHVLDLAPTLLHLFGQPLAKDMPGKVLGELLSPEAKAREPRTIPSYEKKPQTKIPYRDGWPARRFRPLAEDR
ncbi:MAG: alkaline phosphatase family protein [Deltaproteobacteria bacterium]|nr:alkaline phosphatase family protein [Deltaproteobacteria bacterium]